MGVLPHQPTTTTTNITAAAIQAGAPAVPVAVPADATPVMVPGGRLVFTKKAVAVLAAARAYVSIVVVMVAGKAPSTSQLTTKQYSFPKEIMIIQQWARGRADNDSLSVLLRQRGRQDGLRRWYQPVGQ